MAFFLNFYYSNFYLLIVSYYLLQWFLLTHSKSLVVGGNSWSRSWDISLYNFGQQLAQSFPFSPKQDFLGNFTKVIFITRYKLAWCWTIVEPNLPIWPKRFFFERDVFGIFRYMVFINLFSLIMQKTLNKLDNETWNLSLLDFQPQSGQHCSFGPKGSGFFKKFLKVSFVYLFSITKPQSLKSWNFTCLES